MGRKLTAIGLAAAIGIVAVGAVTPAAAEFFGCNDKTSVRNYTNYPSRSARRVTHEFAAQSSRPRITIYPRQTGKRVCRSWLVKEYRVSGAVVVPRQQCWWQ